MTTGSLPLAPPDSLVLAAAELRDEMERLRFSAPVTHVYNPLVYAWDPFEAYLRRFGATRKRILFLGMNPGPWGMVQTGVPFGEITAVRDWLGIDAPVHAPAIEHPKRRVTGFECHRTEISGKRLWGLFSDRFRKPELFFRDHFVTNYCPLTFMEESGRNRTPDKLPAEEARPLNEACDRHLRRVVEILQPEWLIGVGAFAEEKGNALFGDSGIRIGRILHPSPASPLANRDWAGEATRQLQELNVWS